MMPVRESGNILDIECIGKTGKILYLKLVSLSLNKSNSNSSVVDLRAPSKILLNLHLNSLNYHLK
jgi:hypothetical protein